MILILRANSHVFPEYIRFRYTRGGTKKIAEKDPRMRHLELFSFA